MIYKDALYNKKYFVSLITLSDSVYFGCGEGAGMIGLFDQAVMAMQFRISVLAFMFFLQHFITDGHKIGLFTELFAFEC